MGDWDLWIMIPAIFLLTLIYFALGVNGHWSYTETDLIIGNVLVSLGIGVVYLGDFTYRRFKNNGNQKCLG